MKRFILTFILFLFAIVLMAQVPVGFSYQAVVRNNFRRSGCQPKHWVVFLPGT
jgi:hypothetical protein